MKKILLLVVAIFSLTGCMNKYADFYTDETKGQDITKNPYLIKSNKILFDIRNSDPRKDSVQMWENGYYRLGYSSFIAERVNQRKAIDHAKTIKATQVLAYEKHRYTLVNGLGGITLFQYEATYWVKFKTRILGCNTNKMTADDCRKVGTNKGVLVSRVVIGSPAWKNEIFIGDLIIKIGNTTILTMNDYRNALKQNAGKLTDIHLIRLIAKDTIGRVHKQVLLNHALKEENKSINIDLKGI